MNEQVLQQLVDRAAIEDLLVRHAIAQDERNWDALRACYLPTATYTHPGGELRGVDEIVGRTSSALTPLDSCQHLVGTTVVTVAPDGASAESVSYFQAQHLRRGLADGELFIIAGTYRDRFERDADGAWRIAQRRQEYSWRDGNPEVTRRAPAAPAGS